MRLLFFIFCCLFISPAFSQKLPVNDSNNYRPLFHFTPKQNWINDPNGLVYYKGNYQLFYQYNPFGNTWGHMSWGHAVSKDLMKWKEIDVAIPEEKNADSTIMIFSGNAVVDSFNTSGFGTLKNPAPLVAVYTANIIKGDTAFAQQQNIAWSLDGIHFTQYSQNPVLDIHAKDFRDPKIFWYAPAKKWVMIVSKPDLYKVLFYSSPDLKTWTFLSEFGDVGNQDRVWECPDIFEMPVENTTEKKWVITVSAGHPAKGYLAMQYFIGDFDGNSFKADKLPYPLYLDYGKDFYAGITYNNLPEYRNRRIMIGWGNCWEYANEIPTIGYRGMMAIPRELSLMKSDSESYMLKQQPVGEVNNYRSKLLFTKKKISLQNGEVKTGVKGDALDIEFILEKFSRGMSGIKVLKNGSEETVIYFDQGDNSVKIDRTKSGNTGFSEKFPGIESVAMLSGNSKLKFRVLIDKSIVEVFINDGARVITDLVFPNHQNGTVSFFSTGANTSLITNVKIWKMRSSGEF